MKTINVFILLIIITIVFSGQALAKDPFSTDPNYKSTTFSTNSKYFSLSYSNISYFGGLGINLAEEIPEYNSFTDPAHKWWEDKGEKNKNNQFEIFLGKNFQVSPKLTYNLAAGITYQNTINLYQSTKTDWYWGQEDTDYNWTWQSNLQYNLTNKYKINLGYHNQQGILLGLNFSF